VLTNNDERQQSPSAVLYRVCRIWLSDALIRSPVPVRDPDAGRARCPRRHRLPSNAHDERQDCTPRRWPLRCHTHRPIERSRRTGPRRSSRRSDWI